MDFHPGGDLFTIVERKEGGMSEKEARFYLVEIGKFKELPSIILSLSLFQLLVFMISISWDLLIVM